MRSAAANQPVKHIELVRVEHAKRRQPRVRTPVAGQNRQDGAVLAAGMRQLLGAITPIVEAGEKAPHYGFRAGHRLIDEKVSRDRMAQRGEVDEMRGYG